MTILRNKVSVVIPNYNYAKYIKRRIWSVIKQTYPIYELIILDDVSTDGSDKIIENEILKIREKYPKLKVKFIRNEKNSGKVIKQWERGFKEASGDFVWIAEADDLSNKHFLEKVMRGFDDSEVVISYSESAIINGMGMILAPNFRWSRDKEKTGHYKNSYIKDGQDEIKEIMAIRCTIPNVSAVIFKKNGVPYEKLLKEAEKFTQVGDWYFYTKILENGKISYNKKSLNYFRVHKGSVTNDAKKAAKHYEEVLEIHKILAKKYSLSDVIMRQMKNEGERIKNRAQNA